MTIHKTSIRVFLAITIVVSSSFVPTAVFGWGGPSHSNLASRIFSDPAVAPLANEFLTSGQRSTITGFTGEPPDSYHHPSMGSWYGIFQNRSYYAYESYTLWPGLNEETKLKYLMHMACDSGVPLGHSPANSVYTDTIAEAALELQVSGWSSYPNVTGSSYSGTYAEVWQSHQNAVVANANWLKGRSKPWYLLGSHTSDDNRTAGWKGTEYAQKFGRAFFVDYFLSKRDTIASAGGAYAVNPGGSVTFNSAGSQDPDSITWSSNGTYSNNGGGLTEFGWDLNNNGSYTNASGQTATLNHSQLASLIGYTEGKTIGVRVKDNEGKYGYAQSTLAVYSNPTAGGKAEYGWLGKPGDVPSAWDWDNLIDNGSNDLDGGSITTWSWDLDNDGDFDVSGDSSHQVYYSDFTAQGITANENHTVTLRVTDNEGANSTFQSGILMPILVNPVAQVADAQISPGQLLNLTGSAYDPDGGIITTWDWDLDGDGSFDDWTGQSLSLSYLELAELGLSPGDHTIYLKATDNDADITGWWAGTDVDTAILSLTAPMQGDTNFNGTVDFSDLNTLLTNYNQSGNWLQGDFTDDGVVNFSDLNALLTNYNHTSGSLSIEELLADIDLTPVPEPSSIVLLTMSLVLGCCGWLLRQRHPKAA